MPKKFRTADVSYDGNLEEGAMCGKLNSEKNDGFLRDKVWHGLKETYEDLSKVKNSYESLYDKFKHGIDAAYKDVNKIKDTIHENMMGGEIIRVTRPPNPAGVYVAEVKVDGIVKQAKSSFFPKDWNRVQVVDSIKEAYTNRVQIAPNKYVGQTSSGFKVEMIIENGEITTAYPKYTRR